MEEDGPSSKEPQKVQAMSFSVGFNEPAKNPARMPKHLARSVARSKRKPELSEASIAEKQKLAEKRRKVSCPASSLALRVKLGSMSLVQAMAWSRGRIRWFVYSS